MTIEEIDEHIQVQLRKSKEITDNPANANPPGSLQRYKKPAQKKLDQIGREITHLLAEKRKLQGRPVPADGYSGRNSNKR